MIDRGDEVLEVAGEPQIIVAEVRDDLAGGALEAPVVGAGLAATVRGEVAPEPAVNPEL